MFKNWRAESLNGFCDILATADTKAPPCTSVPKNLLNSGKALESRIRQKVHTEVVNQMKDRGALGLVPRSDNLLITWKSPKPRRGVSSRGTGGVFAGGVGPHRDTYTPARGLEEPRNSLMCELQLQILLMEKLLCFPTNTLG